LNKLVIATAKGLQLWNIKTGKWIHSYVNVRFEGRVIVMTDSPLVDLCGVGTDNGEIKVINLRSDETLIEMNQDKPVLSLSFSSDEEMEESLLCSSSGSEILFWNLNE